MTQYWSLAPKSLQVASFPGWTPYVYGELTDQYDDTDSENREFTIGIDEIPEIIEFLNNFMDKYGKKKATEE